MYSQREINGRMTTQTKRISMSVKHNRQRLAKTEIDCRIIATDSAVELWDGRGCDTLTAMRFQETVSIDL